MLNIVFMGTPDFAKESLEKIYKEGYHILAVVTNPDRPKGRGMKMVASPVKEFAIQNNLLVYQPIKIREIEEELKALKPDLFCVVAYGKILPKDILEIPTLGSINVHGSLLPQYRGAAPIQWAVINGEKTTGVTTMYMDEGMDTGDMILKEEVEIGENETTGELWERLSHIGANLLVKTLEKIENKTAPRIPQTGDFSMAPMLKKEMAKIDWKNQTAEEIKNLVRGLNPIMGVSTEIEGKRLKIWKAETKKIEQFFEEYAEYKDFEAYSDRIEELENGTIIGVEKRKGVYVKTKKEVLIIKEIQAENAKRMSIEEYLKGNQMEIGQILN